MFCLPKRPRTQHSYIKSFLLQVILQLRILILHFVTTEAWDASATREKTMLHCFKHTKTENDFCINFWFLQYCEPVYKNCDGPRVKELFTVR